MEVLKIGTLNCRSLRDEWQGALLVRLASQLEMDVLAVQEHHIQTSEGIASKEMGGDWLFNFTWASDFGGVGVLLSPRLRDLVTLTSLSSRLLRVELKLPNQKVHFFCCYAPTATDDFPIREEFFDDLGEHVENSFNTGYMPVALGDFNAPLKKSPHSPHVPRKENYLFVKAKNRNTSLLENILIDRDMGSVLTHFDKDFHQLVTFVGSKNPKKREKGLPYGNKVFAQIDHILVQKVEARSRFSDCCTEPRWKFPSDHKLLHCNLTLDEKLPATPKIRYHWFESEANWERFSEAFEEALSTAEQPSDFAKFEVAVKVACMATQDTVVWREEDVVEKMESYTGAKKREEELEEESYLAYLKWRLNSRSIRLYERFRRSDRYFSRQTFTKTRKNLIRQTKQVRKDIRDSFSDKLVSLVQDFLSQMSCESETTPCSDTTPPQQFDDLPLPDGEPLPNTDDFCVDSVTTSEVQKAANNALLMPQRPNAVEVPPESLCVTDVADRVRGFCNTVLNGGAAPSEWLKTHKTHDGLLFDCSVATLHNTLLSRRLRNTLAPFLLPKNQASTKSVLMELHATSWITFAEFEFGFTAVRAGSLQKLLAAYNVPKRLIHGVLALYPNLGAKLRSGDALSSFLETLVVDWLLKSARMDVKSACLISQSPEEGLTLMSCSQEAAQSLAQRLENCAGKIGLQISFKTKILKVVGEKEEDRES